MGIQHFKHERWELEQHQSLPLEAKIQKSLIRIREWYDYYQGDVHVSFSGGKDSTALLHLVRSIYPQTPAVFVNTGLEFPEIVQFALSAPNLTVLRPKMSFRDVLLKYGYPVVSKEQASYIERVQRGHKNAVERYMTGKGKFTISKKWQHLAYAPFRISGKCCTYLKKQPFSLIEKTSKPFVGTMAGDSRLRFSTWLKQGCNFYAGNYPQSKPLSFWKEDDIWEYLRQNKLPYSKIYDMGYQRTGCIFCLFGIHLEKTPNRIQRLKSTHPALHAYCVKDLDKGGLGIGRVLDHLKIPYE